MTGSHKIDPRPVWQTLPRCLDLALTREVDQDHLQLKKLTRRISTSSKACGMPGLLNKRRTLRCSCQPRWQGADNSPMWPAPSARRIHCRGDAHLGPGCRLTAFEFRCGAPASAIAGTNGILAVAPSYVLGLECMLSQLGRPEATRPRLRLASPVPAPEEGGCGRAILCVAIMPSYPLVVWAAPTHAAPLVNGKQGVRTPPAANRVRLMRVPACFVRAASRSSPMASSMR